MSQNVSFFSQNLFYTYIKNYLGAKQIRLLFFSAQIDYRLDPKWINDIPDIWRSIRASVGHLLTRAFSLPCSTGAMAFAQLVQPNSQFQLALDALLPILDSNKPAEVT